MGLGEEAGKVGTGQSVGLRKAGTCLTTGTEEVWGGHWWSTAVAEGGKACETRPLFPQAPPLLGLGSKDTGTQHVGRGAGGSGEHLGTGNSGHRRGLSTSEGVIRRKAG